MRGNTRRGWLDRIARRREAPRRRRRRGGAGAGAGRSQWLVLLAAALPGLAAVAALQFTWREVRVAEQGQLTTRFNDAITHLGSPSLDVRFGGIYALERIMQDSPRDQPRVVSVLSAYVRRHAPVPAAGFAKEPEDVLEADKTDVPTDVEAATGVLLRRRPGKDGSASLDWSATDLRGLMTTTWDPHEIAGIPHTKKLPRPQAPLRFAILNRTDFRHATLAGLDLRRSSLVEARLDRSNLLRVDLTEAQLDYAVLAGALIAEANLSGASLVGADLRDVEAAEGGTGFPVEPTDLSRAMLWDADLRGAVLPRVNLRSAILVDADLTGASLRRASLDHAKFSTADPSVEAQIATTGNSVDESANLTRTDLTGADLTGADLRGVNLSRANLRGANLTRADFRGADLTGAVLTDAKTDGARGLPPS
ncbi:pentapeptide repeat-containing protein [Streptomyces sp. NPDC015232]|uniref:pentapeptide repeat-containing protein n=1 Tax=unclassified Streptomyces TaxID=2593676 RepID=UPI0036F63498